MLSAKRTSTNEPYKFFCQCEGETQHPKTLLLSHLLQHVWFVGASCVTLLSSWGSKKLFFAAKYKLQLQIDCLAVQAMVMLRPKKIFVI